MSIPHKVYVTPLQIDEEVGADQIEYSDDEEERMANLKAKAKRKGESGADPKKPPSRTSRKKPNQPTQSQVRLPGFSLPGLTVS